MLAFGVSAAVATAAGLPKGNVIVARSAPTALLIWDASAAVGDLVIAQQTGDAGMRALESDAVALMAARAPRLRANTIELHVQYAASGIVGAAYQASTFANATPLMILSAPRALVAKKAQGWMADIDAQRKPAGLDVRMTGSFPHAE